jgi:hypothetical protein
VAVSTTVFFTIVGDDWSREHVLEALNASVLVSVAGFAIAALASLLLPSRAQVQAHLEEARRLAEADAEADAAAEAAGRPAVIAGAPAAPEA